MVMAWHFGMSKRVIIYTNYDITPPQKLIQKWAIYIKKMPLPCFCGDGQNPNPPLLTALMETDSWQKLEAFDRFFDALNHEERSVISHLISSHLLLNSILFLSRRKIFFLQVLDPRIQSHIIIVSIPSFTISVFVK